MRATPIDEATWWAAAAAGDSRAFSRLFATHRDDVFRYARRLTDTPADADDIAAATFLELWRRRDAIRLLDGSIRPWLLVTAGNLARNHRRGTRRWQAVLQQLPRDPDTTDPAELATARISAHRGDTPLAHALRRLPPIDLSLLTLTVFEGYSTTEAATALGIPDTTARSRLSRARTRLRHHLQPETTPALAAATEEP